MNLKINKPMRKLFISCMAVAAIAFASQSANAQQTVQTGASATYNTGGTGSSTFHWDVSGTAQASTTNSMNYTWNTAGSYTVNVYGISANNCNGATQTLNVTVSNTLPVTLAMGAISALCPYQAANQIGGGDPISILTFTGATAGQSVSVAYEIYDGATLLTSGTANGTAIDAGLTSTVTFDESITNTSGASISREVRITSYTVAGTNYVPAVEPSQNATIYSSPVTNAITY
jgi:PKD repeat protein